MLNVVNFDLGLIKLRPDRITLTSNNVSKAFVNRHGVDFREKLEDIVFFARS